MRTLSSIVCSVLGIAFCCGVATAQNSPTKISLPSKDEVNELSSKAADKIKEYKKAIKAASSFLDPETATNYSNAASTAELLVSTLQKNGPSAYGLVSLMATLDDMDVDSDRAALVILSRISAGTIPKDKLQSAMLSVMALSEVDKSLSDISELVMHATLRYVSVEESIINEALSKETPK